MADTLDTLAERLALEQLSENTYASKQFPHRMGNLAPIAYGGFTLGIAINAAAMSVRPEHYPYSVTGCFLGPLPITQKPTLVVENLRDTRTFSTRLVKVMQGDRVCLVMTADFRLPEPALLTFNPTPFRKYTSWENCPTDAERTAEAVRQGSMTEKQAKDHQHFFKTLSTYWDVRACPEGWRAQNFDGMLRDVKTTQHDAPMSDRTSADWWKVKGKLDGRQNLGAATFLLDGTLSFLPLTHSNLFLTDTGASSTLDFALRIFSPELNMEKWHLTEKRTFSGSLGLTHSVTNMFDTDGQIVAQMSQQCILRVKSTSREVKKGKL